ncbi:MAG: S41 family peptidase [Bacillota bacterium]|nr:S41 family peptidase [Bacillota bacterium]
MLELRDNGGGLVDEAVTVARQLVPTGPVAHIIGKQSSQVVKAEGPGLGLPIVVLANKGTASASEILAGALVDRCKAVLVGSPTFGKGSVQAVIPLGGGSAVRLTTARYLTPNGHVLEGNPLKPQILVEEEDRGPKPKFSWRRPLKVLTVGLDVLAAQELLRWLGYPVALGEFGRDAGEEAGQCCSGLRGGGQPAGAGHAGAVGAGRGAEPRFRWPGCLPDRGAVDQR